VEAFLVSRFPNVRYLTGFTGSNGQLVFTPDGGMFLTDGRYTEQSRREVPDLDRSTYSGELDAAVADACRELGVHRLGFESRGVTYRTHDRLSGLKGIELVPTEDEVERMRWTKDAEEIRLIQRAQALTDEAFERILPKLVEGITEWDVALELEWSMRQGGAEGVAFDPVVAFGEGAAEPHHDPGPRDLRRGDVIKLDFGALCEGYHADMTRTVAFGEPPAELRRIHDVVRTAQQAGVEAIAAGVPCREPDRRAREVVSAGGYGDRFPHSLGHGVGLEIHEGPGLRAAAEDILPEGAVVTVEPGIYVPGLGGARIEDMVEVTPGGCRPMPASSHDLLVV
jgi:Xaa-Pro aminopeptidase